jgi:hypothetical protein
MHLLEHSMLNTVACPASAGLNFRLSWMPPSDNDLAALCQTPAEANLDDEAANPVEWSEEDIVFLHWRLLQEVSHLADPEKPLEEKFDTLRWVFTERDKDTRPFSFANCLRVVGCSPLSPVTYCGLVDVEEVRDRIQSSVKAWLFATLERYPDWVRDAVVKRPEWVEERLIRNPQWINEQIKRLSTQGDLFA